MTVSHICRQLRLEFPPLYLAKLHVLKPLHSLDRYLEAIGQEGVGDITVLDRPFLLNDRDVNILPLFESVSSGLNIELEPRAPAIDP
jgi:hypothetical protein